MNSNSTNSVKNFASEPQKMLLLFLIIVIIVMIGVKIYSLYVDTKIYMNEDNMYLRKVWNAKVKTVDEDFPPISCYEIKDPKSNKHNNKVNGINGDRFPAPNGVFTYSFWIYVNGVSPHGKPNDDWGSYKYGEWKHIMHRGTPMKGSNTDPSIDPNIKNNWNKPAKACYMIDNVDVSMKQLPGFYLAPTLNKLYCQIRRTSKATDIESEQMVIENLPLNKWVNITYVFNRTNMSLYMNGKLERTTMVFLPINIEEFNHNRLYITQGGGFAGRLWNLQYFPTALEPTRIYRMYKYYLGKIQSKDMKLHKKKKKCDDCDDDVEASLMKDFDVPQIKATIMNDYKKTKSTLNSDMNNI